MVCYSVIMRLDLPKKPRRNLNVSVRLEPEVVAILKELAKKSGGSQADVITYLLRQAVER